MAFTQTTFLGASIRNAQCGMGWGVGQPSSVTVQLAEDPLNGDSFYPTATDVGKPVIFQFGSMKFEGLLQSYGQREGADGRPLYEATITDPREVLAGAQIIIGGYNGSVGSIPNLINAYGWHENQQFGASKANAAGMPWVKIREALNAITGQPSATTYGGPLQFRGETYSLDLSQMPVPPSYYRVGSNSVGLLDVIASICEDGGYDFFVELVGRAIRIRTVNRANAPSLGTLSSLITSNTGNIITRSQHGVELRNEVTSSFLVGGEVTTIYVARDDDIETFWGYDLNGNPVTGEAHELKLYDKDTLKNAQTAADNDGVTLQKKLDEEDGNGDLLYPPVQTVNTEIFELNAAPIADILGDTKYRCTEFELRLAQFGYEAWAIYFERYRNALYKQLGLLSVNVNNVGDAVGGNKQIPVKWDLINDDPKHTKSIEQLVAAADAKITSMTLFEFVKGYADEYMGRKFLVRVPDIESTQDSETGEITTNYEVTDAGYLTEDAEPPELSELNEEIFQVPDGRFRSFVEYRTLTGVDLNSVSPQGSVIENNILFMESQVSTKIIRGDSPGVILTVGGPVKEQVVDQTGNINQVAGVLGNTVNQTKKLNATSHLDGIGVAPATRKPDIAAIPLKSNVDTYGPWFIAGASGKVKFEQDPSLTPWNYAGFSLMNLAGNSRVKTAVTNQQESESGTLELAEAPRISLGDQMQSGGPNCTGIDLQMGDNGVTTTYRFHTFTPRFGVFNKSDGERFKRLAVGAQSFRKSLKAALRDKQIRDDAKTAAKNTAKHFFQNAPKQFKKKSPHEVLVSFNSPQFEDGSGDVRQVLQTSSIEEALPLLNAGSGEDYRRTAMMSLNGILRPFSTKVDADPSSVLMPHYIAVDPDASGFIANKDKLDPFKAKNDIEMYLWGDEYPSGVHAWRHEDDVDHGNIRALGLRSPLVLVGWGMDWYGGFAPSGEDKEWPEDVLTRQDLHKAGPADLLWDERRGVWTCHDIIRCKAKHDIIAFDSGRFAVNAELHTNFDGDFEIYAKNYTNSPISSGDFLSIGYSVLDHQWIVLGAPSQCGSRNEIWMFSLSGFPSGGTFSMDFQPLDVSEIVEFDWDSNASGVNDAISQHPIASGNVNVTGGPLPDNTIILEFINDLADTYIPAPIFGLNSLTGNFGIGIDFSRYQPGGPNDNP